MPAPTYASDDLVIFDRVLTEPQLQALSAELASTDFQPAKSYLTNGAWVGDHRDPLEGPRVVLPAIPLPAAIAAAALPPRLRLYPSGGSLDSVLQAVEELAKGFETLTGVRGRDWLALVGTPWRYGHGTALTWHTDHEVYSGAFIFYAHSSWHPGWGGELLVAEGCGGGSVHYSKSDAARIGFGRYVTPVPNRLVLLRGGTPHRVVAVAAAAEHPRQSIAGHFVTPAGVAAYLAEFGGGMAIQSPPTR